MDQVQMYQSKLDAELSKFPVLKQLEQQTGVPKVYAVVALAFILLTLIFLNVAPAFIVNVIGFIYPAALTFSTVESLLTSKSADKDTEGQLLVYWVLYSFLSMLDVFSEMIQKWFPFYYIVKLAALIYLLWPQTKGALVLYQTVVRPVLLSKGSTATTAKAD